MLVRINQRIQNCRQCQRLLEHCRTVAVTKRRAYADEDYWGQPVPSFGDPDARLLIIGLAPGAHGANRTGRMFTGDASGDFLYRALYETGFASQPSSRHAKDGLQLQGVYITAAAHCAPPGNKPSPEELRQCRPYLAEELRALRKLRAVVALGRVAFDAYLRVIREDGAIETAAPFRFAHNALHDTGAGQPRLISSYHPSQQNTLTGRLTMEMLIEVFVRAREFWRPAP
jgi:uracil-DNA glycosylase family 4